MGRIVCEDSVRRALKSANERDLDTWLARHEKDVFDKLLSYQYVIDIDNAVKPIFGHQEDAELGYNPQKPGRPSRNFHSFKINLPHDIPLHSQMSTSHLYYKVQVILEQSKIVKLQGRGLESV